MRHISTRNGSYYRVKCVILGILQNRLSDMVLHYDLFCQANGLSFHNCVGRMTFSFICNQVFERYGLECHLCHTALIKNAYGFAIYHRKTAISPAIAIV